MTIDNSRVSYANLWRAVIAVILLYAIVAIGLIIYQAYSMKRHVESGELIHPKLQAVAVHPVKCSGSIYHITVTLSTSDDYNAIFSEIMRMMESKQIEYSVYLRDERQSINVYIHPGSPIKVYGNTP